MRRYRESGGIPVELRANLPRGPVVHVPARVLAVSVALLMVAGGAGATINFQHGREARAHSALAEVDRSLQDAAANPLVATSMVTQAEHALDDARVHRREVEVQDAAADAGLVAAPQALRAGEVDAIVLAMAGLRRLGREDEVSFTFGLDEMTPAAGQGSLVVQTRTGGAESTGAPGIDDDASNRELRAERAAVVGLEADCSSPVGIHARHKGDVLVMDGFIGLADGSEWIRDKVEGDPSRPEDLGGELARRLKQAGGADILARAQEKFPGLDV